MLRWAVLLFVVGLMIFASIRIFQYAESQVSLATNGKAYLLLGYAFVLLLSVNLIFLLFKAHVGYKAHEAEKLRNKNESTDLDSIAASLILGFYQGVKKEIK
jgi:surface polysaccharide O-acyltransferase-like enzyme